MGIPFGGGGDDGDGGDRYYRDEEVFSTLPEDWQDDPFVQHLYSEMMGTDNWADAHEWHDQLQDYIADQYGYDFDDFFDWDDWRESYDQRA